MKLPPVVLIGAGLGVLGLVLYRGAGGAGGLARELVSGAYGVASEVASEGVLSIGDAIGLPRTDRTECEQLLADGRTWDASFVCPAGTWIRSLGSSSTSRPSLNVIDDVHGNTWYTPII